MGAAALLRPALRGATYEALFGLLSCTGLRVGEAIALDRGDVDLRAGVLEINDAKFRKHRRVPLHPSAVAALRHYAELRDRLCPRPRDPSFFVSTRGTRLLYVCVNEVIRSLVEEIGLTAQPRASRPKIHGLRHSFAMASVQDFHRSGGDPEGKLPLLSAYMGHSDIAWTYWYLQASPELLGLAAKRLERFEEGRR
jgi:integrase/recombinase XerD